MNNLGNAYVRYQDYMTMVERNHTNTSPRECWYTAWSVTRWIRRQEKIK